MNIENLGPSVIEQLIDAGKLKCFEDFYHLTKEDFLELEGFKEKKAQKSADSINKSRNTTLDRVITALGIPLVGEKASKTICEHFNYDFNALNTASAEEISAIQDVGEKMAYSLRKYLDENKTAIAYFSDYSTPTQGTSFVLKTIPWAYTTVIPYDDNFTQTADITISAVLGNDFDVDPLYIAPTVRLSSDGINIWVPVFNTVQYGLDPLTSQPLITAFETKICPKKLLLILNSPTGSVVRLNGFSNRYRVGEGYGIILSTSSWSQSGTKYVGRVSGLFTNRFTDLEMIFESNEDSDRYYSANVRVKKSADWLTGTLTSDVTEFIADSMPEGQIRAHAYPIISY